MSTQSVLTGSEQHTAIRRRIWMACIWSWPIGLVIFGVGFMFFARFIPPPPPSWGAGEVARFFAANTTGIRIGVIAALFGSVIALLPFYTIVSAEIRRIEGSPGILATMQYGGAIVLVTFFQIIGLAWLVASFRPEASPDVIRAFNDYCWMVWMLLIPSYMVQFICMALAGFMDTRKVPTWPRWAAYLNLWVAVTGAGGILAVFFKTGPFAWNGIIGFWVPVILFVVGMSVTCGLLLRRAKLDWNGEPESSGQAVSSAPDAIESQAQLLGDAR